MASIVNQEFTLRRTIPVTAIPSGEVMRLHEGSLVFVTQALGTSVTVRSEHGSLFRIGPKEVDALGIDPEEFARMSAATPVDATAPFSEERVWDAMRSCFDPEIPVNIVDLGLVYDLSVEDHPEGGGRLVEVKMTLTAQGCGMGPVIADDARQRILALPGVREAKVHIVWDPVWNPRMISENGRKILGIE
jgi:probable FeS assembly SUF system protein SufT